MTDTSNIHVRELTPIISPESLKQVFPLSEGAAQFVLKARNQIRDIIFRRDRRLMVIVGPCSIHDPHAALDYARRLSALSAELHDQLLLVMRVYFEKPRTTIGWKGLINDPDIDGTHAISKGLGIARGLQCSITELGLPVATEMLDPITPQYMSDFISWGAIGARTTESQPHREIASALSFPVGFKNGTDGGLQVAIDAMGAACNKHSFLGINGDGRTAIVHTVGNKDVHIVLRGGNGKPNYSAEHIARTEALLAKVKISSDIMVDCSHANSFKDHARQEEVVRDVMAQIAAGNQSICALMVESFLEEGNQPTPQTLADFENLKYGVSITDKCIDWATTERLLRSAHQQLKAMGGRKID
ncbi:MAG: 3-deoxy-7-phosphoheptulonate synthase [Desulfuromonadales bacterium]|nr:3-deoxy-7-phosphoheptulonate synthase [Desulfuromonadales bacterium]MDT8424309.1 3-deoxy-7-phosphoheptulonate synthase [Desulfuromonadales bacterium]